MTLRKQVRIPVGQTEAVSGVLAIPMEYRENRSAVIVAHGAGNDMESPLVVGFGCYQGGTTPSKRPNHPVSILQQSTHA